MKLSPDWEYVSDTVMGGVSTGEVTHRPVAGRPAARLTGAVSLDNNGGFIQMAFDVADGQTVDASVWEGIEFEVRGNAATYEMRLRTDQLARPWQSFRAAFDAPTEWSVRRLPFDIFEPHRTDVRFDSARLRRIGVLAIGSEMEADIAICETRFY
ncbi:CIA30 family protein [uncultured Sulfitobacter sp.]|uniref:CIA30 family protein n=1 Tax=uncultured Sulfitobacter sp. TaxID=191468 RepID=UPI00260A5425|nr:CIA30 family protein [uncultured Sulfitobacter sp.]